MTWGFKSSSTPAEPPHAPAPIAQPAAAIPPSAPTKPTDPEKIAVTIESDVSNAHVVFRRHVTVAPMAAVLAPNPIVELVEVSAPGYKTERYWLTLDRATHLKAHLVKGAGLDEASEEATLTALGEVATQPAAAAAPVVAIAKTVEKPTTAARLAPRKIGRTAEVPVVQQLNEEPAPAIAEAAPAPSPPPPAVEPTPAPAALPVPEVAKPVEAAPVAVAITPPHNISPAAFKAMRTSGTAEIEAPITIAKQIVRDGKTKVSAAVKACVSITGEVASVAMIKSSGYPEYDRALLDGVRTWRFKSGEAVCSAVTFAYKP